MLPSWLHANGASTTRLEVDVTFLEVREGKTFPVLPDGIKLRRVAPPAVTLYRELYREVGEAYCWWMRRSMPDQALATVLHHPDVYFMVLYDQKERPIGFYELDLRDDGDANLAYFGLVPAAVGMGLGGVFLDCAVAQAFAAGNWRLRVNTCSLDHPRALDNYLRHGFVQTQVVREIWDVPDVFVPEKLRRL